MEMDWLAWWTYNKTNNRTVSWANVITYKSRSVPVWIAHKLEIQKKMRFLHYDGWRVMSAMNETARISWLYLYSLVYSG